jgi:hypothetical protein
MGLVVKTSVIAALLAWATVMAISPPTSHGTDRDLDIRQLSRLEQIFLLEPLLHNAHLLWRVFPRER